MGEHDFITTEKFVFINIALLTFDSVNLTITKCLV